MFVVVITGPPGSGKSLVARWLCLHPQFHYVSADAWVREAYGDPEIVQQLIALMGRTPVEAFRSTAEGIHRVRQWVRENPLERLKALESVFHPYIWRRWEKWMQEPSSPQRSSLIYIYEAPLYFEAGQKIPAQCRVLVGVSFQTGWQRAAQRPGFCPRIYEAFWQRQWPLEKKVLLADYVIWNEGTLVQLGQEVYRLQKWIGYRWLRVQGDGGIF